MRCVASELLLYLRSVDLLKENYNDDYYLKKIELFLKESVSKEDCVEKKRRGRPRKNKKMISSSMSELNEGGGDLIASLVAEAEKSKEEEDSINVKKITINSVIYLISKCDDIYDFDTHEHIGIYKKPVAAGRASNNFKFSIKPGAPEESIMPFRMQSRDPGIMMPESGRFLNHDEGVALINKWIKSM